MSINDDLPVNIDAFPEIITKKEIKKVGILLYKFYSGKIAINNGLNNKYINVNATEKERLEINALTLYPEGHENAWFELGDFTYSFPNEILKSDEPIVVVVVGIVN